LLKVREVDPESSGENKFELQKVWDPAIRIWHWLLVITVTSGWLLGEFRNFSIMQWHMYAGYATGVLLLLRILWGFIGPPPVRFSALAVTPSRLVQYASKMFRRQPSGVAGHNPIGAISVILILTLLSLQVVTGLFSEDDALFFDGPLASSVSSSARTTFTSIHHMSSEALLIVIALHVAAILFYLLWKRENLVRAMFTGWKLVKKKTV
jgi:cytochrome b